MKYLTHGLPVEGVLRVEVGEVAGAHWNVLSRLEFQVQREGGVLDIEIPPSDKPAVLIHFDFEKCYRLAFSNALNSIRGRDFLSRRVTIKVSEVDFPAGLRCIV
jgi:hypothetical protein